jgi:hypothetical protein
MSLTARRSQLSFDLAAASLITLIAGFFLLNGSMFSTASSLHVDFSINWTAAHALRDGQNPYGITTLAERAGKLDGPTGLIYGQLFTSYIQPPTSAILITPLTFLPWREATRVWLLLNHLFLAAAVCLTLVTVRPALPRRWVVAGAVMVLALFSQIYGSFALGQVDALQVFLLSLGFWAFVRGKPAVCGASIACAAAIKLIPGLLLLYFLWRRDYRIVMWGAGVGLALLLLSMAYAGVDVYETYLTETIPALSKGSTHYSNISFGALIARLHTPEVYRGLPEMIYLDEVASSTWARIASAGVILAGLLALLAVVPRRVEDVGQAVGRRLCEYYFVVAVGLLVSSVTWEFYVVWLLPVFLAAFLAPSRVLPAGRARWGFLAALAVAFVALNYPGDSYLFSPNAVFYHPSWVPGVMVEDVVRLYERHPDAVLLLRLPGLMLLTATLALLVRWPHNAPAETAGSRT